MVCPSSSGLERCEKPRQGHHCNPLSGLTSPCIFSCLTLILIQVSSVAAEVFYEGEGVQPIIDFSKLTYSIELLLRLGWRVGKLGSTSCFAIAHATGCSYSYKVQLPLVSNVLAVKCIRLPGTEGSGLRLSYALLGS